MWICEQKIYNNGKVSAEVYGADDNRSIATSFWFEKNPSYHERMKSYEIYYDSFKTLNEALKCKEDALSENA
jgi:hypothetical protein